MAIAINAAKARLKKNQLAVGIGIRLVRNVDIIKVMKAAGFDWLFLDLEHGVMSIETAAEICVAAQDSGIAPIVRVPDGQLDMATRALDGGGWGIVMPHVDTPEEAAELVAHVKYPPQGHRSVMGALPQFGYRGIGVGETSRIVNAELLTTVMIETPLALENAEKIAAVPGVDVLLIGTNDLAMEMGIPGQFAHEKIVGAYEKVIAACRKHGKWPGMGGIYNQPIMQRYIQMGARFLLSGGDIAFVQAGASARASFLRGIALS